MPSRELEDACYVCGNTVTPLISRFVSVLCCLKIYGLWTCQKIVGTALALNVHAEHTWGHKAITYNFQAQKGPRTRKSKQVGRGHQLHNYVVFQIPGIQWRRPGGTVPSCGSYSYTSAVAIVARNSYRLVNHEKGLRPPINSGGK